MPRIRILDFETSDLEPPEAKVIEVGICDLVLEDANWKVVAGLSALCGLPDGALMSPKARAVHHISPAELVGLPAFDSEAFWNDVEVDGVDVVAAHSLEYEAKFYGTPRRPVICTYKAALRLWPDAPSHSNGALRYWLEDQGLIQPQHHRTMPPHRAAPDAYVTAHILAAALQIATANQMVAWTREPRLLPTCPIGDPWRGKPWAEVDAGFLRWMVGKPVEPDLVWNARRELDRRRE